MAKPDDVFGRDAEWEDLAEFATSTQPGMRIAVVYGRRRQGKSYLLRRLAEAGGGLYHLATEQTEHVALRRFAESLTTHLGLRSSLVFTDWEQALTTAEDLLTSQAEPGRPVPLVLDEFPYLVKETPGLPSIVQALYDQIGPGAMSRTSTLRLILCGSAISVMSELLSGTKALRGRGALELRVKPFNYRDARNYWGIDNPRTAFIHNALIGGTPGYRELVANPNVPENPEKFDTWVARNILRPSVPLFTEADRVIHEDPRIRDGAIYSSIMAVISAGESSPAKIGGLLGRPSSSLSHQLSMLESAGFVDRRQDLLMDRRPAIAVSDPVVRTHHLIIEPHLADLEANRAAQIWAESAHTVDSKILGPHFESIATEWTQRYARAETGLETGVTGQATIACREHRTSHDIDILSLGRGQRPRTAGTSITLIAEAKARSRQPGITQAHRLEHLKELLSQAGHDTSETAFAVFSATGFTDELTARAHDARTRTLLINLDTLYG